VQSIKKSYSSQLFSFAGACLMLKNIYHLLQKEFTLEWRNRYALNGIIVYTLLTTFTVYLAFTEVDHITWNALFWVIMLFTAITTVAKSFMQEAKGRQLYYYTMASPAEVIISKIVYNFLLMLFVSLLAFACFIWFLGNPVSSQGYFILALVLGSMCMASAFTLLSALASKTNSGALLMPVLSIPIIFPCIMVLIKASKAAVDGVDASVILPNILVLGALSVMLITLAIILFPLVWKD
jgi:heme exporter protein B